MSLRRLYTTDQLLDCRQTAYPPKQDGADPTPREELLPLVRSFLAQLMKHRNDSVGRNLTREEDIPGSWLFLASVMMAVEPVGSSGFPLWRKSFGAVVKRYPVSTNAILNWTSSPDGDIQSYFLEYELGVMLAVR